MYEWDESKRRLNLLKHGVAFAGVEGFDWGTVLIRPDTRREYGEPRYVAFGVMNGRLHALIFTPRGGRIRIIGLRKANGREERMYDEAKAEKT